MKENLKSETGLTMASQIRFPRLHSCERHAVCDPFRKTRVVPTTLAENSVRFFFHSFTSARTLGSVRVKQNQAVWTRGMAAETSRKQRTEIFSKRKTFLQLNCGSSAVLVLNRTLLETDFNPAEL